MHAPPDNGGWVDVEISADAFRRTQQARGLRQWKNDAKQSTRVIQRSIEFKRRLLSRNIFPERQIFCFSYLFGDYDTDLKASDCPVDNGSCSSIRRYGCLILCECRPADLYPKVPRRSQLIATAHCCHVPTKAQVRSQLWRRASPISRVLVGCSGRASVSARTGSTLLGECSLIRAHYAYTILRFLDSLRANIIVCLALLC